MWPAIPKLVCRHDSSTPLRSKPPSCMQMEKVQASHQADQGIMQAAVDSLQTQCEQLHSRHRHWAWQLAALLHWKRHGALQMRKLLHSWALLTAATRSHQSTALSRGSIRSTGGVFYTGHMDNISQALGCQRAHSLARRASCTAGAEDELPGLRPVPNGCAHHDRRALGACFTGKHVYIYRTNGVYRFCNVADAVLISTANLPHSEPGSTLPSCLQ